MKIEMPAPSTTAAAKAAAAASKVNKTPDLTRLPGNVIPKRYELKLDVDTEARRYSGEVNIRVYFEAPAVDTVWLHACRLSIESASIQFSHSPVEACHVIHVPEKSCIGLEFSRLKVEKGNRAWIRIAFKGTLANSLEGFFSNPYVDREGKIRSGAATMFAATEARSCFPCFDEPNMKAVFAIEVTVDSELTVISNMPIMDQKSRDKKRTDTFAWTKEMSTYLVCIVIGQYDVIECDSEGGVVVRVFTPFGQREQGRFALEVARRSLEFFNAYFGKRYPLPKLDLVALNRLSVGAMENWGLITCRETGLIVDPNDTNHSTLRKVATLVAHEISHQWFGNLVTMKWWDFLYLNEGFATFMQYVCIDALYPEFQVFNEFCSETVVPALGMDALAHSHPVEVPLRDASEISQVFDKITYCKGAAIINMLAQFIGADVFRAGIRDYIQHFSYSNADTDDLWRFMSAASGLNVGSIMNEWIREMGFPVVKVKLLETPQSDGKATLKLTQERFCGGLGANRHLIWSIPVQGMYMKDGVTLTKFSTLFDKSSMTIELEGLDMQDSDCWLKINPKLAGFYRVQYSEDLFQRLFSHLSSPHLTSVDRMGLFGDQVAMVQTEAGSTVRLLKMAQHFGQYERSYTVWRAVCGILHVVRALTWHDDRLADKLDLFCVKILKPFLEELGYTVDKEEPSNTTLCRSITFGYLATLGDQDVLKAAKAMFRGHYDGSQPMPGSIRDAVYKAVMVDGTMHTFNQMKTLYRSAELAEERNRILHAIGYCQDPNIQSQVLDFAMSSEVPLQDSLVSVVSVASGRQGHRQAWIFFSNNIEKIAKRYSGGLFLMSRLVKAVTECFSDSNSWREILDTFAANKELLVGSEAAVEQAIERVKSNASWREKDLDSLRVFLDSCDEANVLV